MGVGGDAVRRRAGFRFGSGGSAAVGLKGLVAYWGAGAAQS